MTGNNSWFAVNAKCYQPFTHKAWLEENDIHFWTVEVYTYYFKNESEATLFALKWS